MSDLSGKRQYYEDYANELDVFIYQESANVTTSPQTGLLKASLSSLVMIA